MASSPILGGFYRAWSKNLADSECLNLFPNTVDTKTGKAVGALYSCPGLNLLAAIGGGPIRGMEIFKGLLYVVSGAQVYTIDTNNTVMVIGLIPTSSSGPVSIIANTTQMVIFDGFNGYLVPGGQPLASGAIGSGGANYASGDQIYLQANDGTQTATAVIQVSGVSGGAVTAFFVVPGQGGAFNPVPSGFTQQSTTGSGNGFTISSASFGPAVGVYPLTLPFPNPQSASYQDGFGLVNQGGSQKFWQSNLFDLSIWLALNFSSADSAATNIMAIAALHEQQYIFTQDVTEVWINAGTGGFAFQRLSGVHMEIGCAAQASVAKVGESLCFLSQTDQGGPEVHRITAYEPQKISTKAIDGVIQGYATYSDAVGYSYSQDGHEFYVLIFPTANATWVYDATPGIGLWHQRAAFANGVFSRHWSNCQAVFNNKVVVGDYRNGNVYSFDMNAQTDNGTPRKWVRSWRALEKPIYVSVTYSSLQIDMQTGIKIPDGTNPQVVLQWSDDGCHNWTSERFQAAGQTGQTSLRVIFKRLGSTRLNSGLDRVWKLSSSDQFPVALIAAEQL